METTREEDSWDVPLSGNNYTTTVMPGVCFPCLHKFQLRNALGIFLSFFSTLTVPCKLITFKLPQQSSSGRLNYENFLHFLSMPLKKSCLIFTVTFQICLRLPDLGPHKRLASSEEAFSHSGPLCRGWFALGERAFDIPEPKLKIPKAQQALAANRLGFEYRHSSSQGRPNTRRFRG